MLPSWSWASWVSREFWASASAALASLAWATASAVATSALCRSATTCAASASVSTCCAPGSSALIRCSSTKALARILEVSSSARRSWTMSASSFFLSPPVSAELTGASPSVLATATPTTMLTSRNLVERRAGRGAVERWLISPHWYHKPLVQHGTSAAARAAWLEPGVRDQPSGARSAQRCEISPAVRGRIRSAPLHPEVAAEREPGGKHRQPCRDRHEPRTHRQHVGSGDEVDRQLVGQVADAVLHHGPQQADRQRRANHGRHEGLEDERGGADQPHDAGLPPPAERRLADGRGHEQHRAQHHQAGQGQRPVGEPTQHVEQRVEDPPLVLDVTHAWRADERAGDHVVLGRVRQLHPEALGHLLGLDVTVARAVLVLLLETVVRLLL